MYKHYKVIIEQEINKGNNLIYPRDEFTNVKLKNNIQKIVYPHNQKNI